MEFFIPGLLIFIVAIVLSFVIVPRATPLIVALLSIGFLTLGVYEHYKMFSSEYRLSTWQDGLKNYAPAVMICAILIFIIYAIFAFFTKGSVPIPQMPQMPQMPQIPNIPQMPNIANIPNIKGSNNITNTVMQTVNNVVNSLKMNNEEENIKPNNEENGSRSLFETL
jgi:hypothetical protein